MIFDEKASFSESLLPSALLGDPIQFLFSSSSALEEAIEEPVVELIDDSAKNLAISDFCDGIS